MLLEKQLSNLELSKKLKELGVKQESEFYWGSSTNNDFILIAKDRKSEYPNIFHYSYSVFSTSELGEMLPWRLEIGSDYYELSISKNGTDIPYSVYYEKINSNGTFDGTLNDYFFDSNREADARAKMLIYLLENNLLPKEGE